jgi:hypothetical protein
LAEIAAMNSIVVPSQVRRIALLAHKITPSHFLNQSMPRIISMPLESMTMRFNKKSTPPPLMAILIAGHICLVFISPLGEVIIMVYFMMVMGRLCFATNFDDLKECDDENQTKLSWGVSLQGTYPILHPGISGLPQ